MGVILRTTDLKKEYGPNLIFQHVTMALKDGEKAALIGQNGAGKTTFFKCLLGSETIDSGSITMEPGISFGYMEQIPRFAPGTTLLNGVLTGFADLAEQRKLLRDMERQMAFLEEEALEATMKKYGALSTAYEAAGGFDYEVRAKKVLSGLGFSEELWERDIATFSGGEKTKISLARLLVRQHEIMLLDEPTNHLDLASLEWLESYLKSTRSAMLIISHDRYFLDEVTETTFHLANGSLKSYSGNYSRFMEQKEAEDLAYRRAYTKQQQEIKEMEDYINKYRAGIKSKQARGRQSRLNRMERLVQSNQTQTMRFKGEGYETTRSGNRVLSLSKLGFRFPDKVLFENLSYDIENGDRLALIGPNGVGKTTLLRLILDQLSPNSGYIQWGVGVKVGYFDQHHADLNLHNTVLDELLNNCGITVQEARDQLAKCLFQADDIYKTVGDLSGGERARLAFLKIYLTHANFLILDEPTNHMDIDSREAFEAFLLDYPGTILAVSHDRYFLDAIAEKILELDQDGLTVYAGNFTDYKEKKARLKHFEESAVKPVKAEKSKKPGNDQAAARAWRAGIRQQISQLEKEIEAGEARLEELSSLMTENAAFPEKNAQIQDWLREYQTLEKRIPQAYEDWENLSRELEENNNRHAPA